VTSPSQPRWPNPGPDGRLKPKHLPEYLSETDLNATYAPATGSSEYATQSDVDAIAADPTNAVTSIWVPAKSFDAVGSVPTYVMAGNRVGGWNLPKQSAGSNVDTQVAAALRLPSHWTAMTITPVFTILVAGAGNVSMNAGRHDWAIGESINVYPAGGNSIGAVPPNALDTAQFTIGGAAGLAVNPAKTTTLRVDRNGTSASDTWPNPIVLLGVKLAKVVA
jgi:hypothetical protein